MRAVSVVRIEDNSVEEIYTYNGDKDSEVKRAEQKFSKLATNYFTFTQQPYHEFKQDVLDNGYMEYPNGSICLCWSN